MALCTHRDCALISLAPLTCACCADSRFLLCHRRSGGSKLIVSSIADSKVKAEEPQPNHAQGHPGRIRLVIDGVGHSADQGVEQTACTNRRRPRRKKVRQDTLEAHHSSRPTWAGSSFSSRGATQWERDSTRALDFCARLEPLLPTQICDEVRFCRLDKTYKADVKRVTLNIVSPEKRLLVLEALCHTEAERKYGRAPPTAMERE